MASHDFLEVVSVSTSMLNIDYGELVADAAKLADFKAAMGTVLANEAGDGISASAVEVGVRSSTSGNSIIVDLVILPLWC